MSTFIDPAKIHKILVISLSNIGDIILTTPVISLLREHFPSSHLAVLVGAKGMPLFQNSHTVDEAFLFDKKASWLKKLALVFELKRKKFDLLVDLRNTAIPLFVRPRYRTSYLVNRSSISMRQRHLDQLKFLFPVDHPENHFDFFTDEEKKSAFQKLERLSGKKNSTDFIVIAPGAGSELKRWTSSGFVQVADYFLKTGRTIILVGDDQEQNLGKVLEEQVSKPVVNLIGFISLRELAALIDQAALVVANDSAVMHLANELERPTVSIFGPTNEKKYGQVGQNRGIVRLHLECTPCERAQCYLERRVCLDDLPAESVIRTAEDLLTHAPY